MTLFDVEEIPAHVGSPRIYEKYDTYSSREISENVKNPIDKEISFGINTIDVYNKYQQQVKVTKRKLLRFLINAKNTG